MPAAAGTHETELGGRLRTAGTSLEYSTRSFFTPRFFSSPRMVLHKGQTAVS